MSITMNTQSAPATDSDANSDTRVNTGASPMISPLVALGFAPETPSTSDDEFESKGSSFARCSDGNGTLAALFFSEDDYDIARAKAICGPCGLAASCLEGAIERGEPYGVWGGKLMVEGVPVEFKRKRGRPRKNPKPILVVDEVRLPTHLVA